jgi:hypothetical protein
MLGSKRPQNGEHEGERDEHQGGKKAVWHCVSFPKIPSDLN